MTVEELQERVNHLESKVSELYEDVKRQRDVEVDEDTHLNPDEEFDKIIGFLENEEKEDREKRIREYCTERNLDYNDATDYSEAAIKAYPKSEYLQPMTYIGSSLGHDSVRGLSRAVDDVGKVRRDIRRLRSFDRELNQIETYLDNRKDDKRAGETARRQLFHAIVKLNKELEHPKIIEIFRDSVKVFEDKNFRKITDFRTVKKKYDQIIKNHTFLKGLIR